MGPKPVRLVGCDEGGREGEGKDTRPGRAAGRGDGGGILIYYGRDWLMLMSVVVIIEHGGKGGKEASSGCGARFGDGDGRTRARGRICPAWGKLRGNSRMMRSSYVAVPPRER